MLEVTITSPYDLTQLQNGNSVSLIASVVQRSREIWSIPAANAEETRNETVLPVVGADLTWSIDFGDGVVNASSGPTSTDGLGSANLTLGNQPTRVRVEAGYSNISPAISTLDVIPIGPPEDPNPTPDPEPSETWEFTRMESMLLMSLTDDQSQLQSGGFIEIVTEVTLHSWEIWTSNWSRTETRNESISPVSGAFVNVSNNSGVASFNQASTDGSGRAYFQYWPDTSIPGIQQIIFNAEVGYGGSAATATRQVSLDFTPPPPDPPAAVETWTTSQIATVDGLTVSVEGGPQESVPQGSTRTVAAQVTGTIWTYHSSDLGNSYTDPVPVRACYEL